VAELAQSHLFQRIVTVGHRPVPYDGPGKEKLEQHVVDFDKIDENKDLFADIDVGFNTMGTTHVQMQEVLKTLSKLIMIFPFMWLRLFKDANPSKPTHFCLLTSAGSSATSSFLYPRTKGLLEKHITELGFTHVSIFRPAMLLHDGEKREQPRMAEGVFPLICKALNPLTGGRAGSGISTVAKAMTKVAEKGIGADASSQTTVDVYDNRQIIKLADEQQN
jgi:oxidoreductase